MFQLSPAISFVVNCETQGEIDHYWDRLSEDGEKDMCGWVRDKFGVSWQVVPAVLSEMLSDASKSGKVMEALLQMYKMTLTNCKTRMIGHRSEALKRYFTLRRTYSIRLRHTCDTNKQPSTKANSPTWATHSQTA